MRWLFWILGLFALAVALALALRLNAGYALFVWPPYRVELSLNLLALLLAAGFFTGYIMLRFFLGAVRLPSQVREYRGRRSRDRARSSLLDAVSAFFEGRYGRAEKAAVRALEVGESPALSAVVAARAAHEMRRYDARDTYLARAERATPDEVAMRVVTAADLLLDQRRFEDALAALKALPDRHTTALRLELKAQQQAANWSETLPLIDQLERRKVFDAVQADQLRRHAHMQTLKRKGLDQSGLEECWQKIPAAQQTNPKVAAAAAQCWMALGENARATHIVEQALAKEWDSGLAALYAECSGDTIGQIERAENWLKMNPRDGVLLLTLGRLCARQGLWGKAQNYLEASIAVEPTYTAHLAAAQLHDQLGNSDAARRHYRQSLDLAVGQLKQIAGGRRRMTI